MAETTPNLGLEKPLESEFVSINTLNENMDSIDQALGALDELPTSSANVAGAISEIYDQLAAKPANQLTLTQGVQVVQGGDVPAILHPTMEGRTLVNHIGRRGSFESLDGWLVGVAPALDTTTYKFGTKSGKLDNSAGTGLTAAYNVQTMNLSGKKVLVGAWVKAASGAPTVGVQVRAYTAASNGLADFGVMSQVINNTWRFYWAKIDLTNPPTNTSYFRPRLTLNTFGTANDVVNFDGVVIYELSDAEFSRVHSQAEIEALYPYVDDMKHVNAVYIENKGKNLLPPFSEWRLQDNGESTAVDAYKMVTTATAIQCYRWHELEIVPNQAYTFSVTHNGKITVVTYDNNRSVITNQGYQSDQLITVTTESNAKYMRVFCSNDTLGVGTYTFSNPMLNVGSEPLPFEPQKPSYLYLPDCNLRSNVDGSVADRLYTDGQGKPRVTRRFREMALLGSLDWTFNQDGAGFKSVRFTRTSDLLSYQTASVIKYDGRNVTPTGAIANGADLFTADASRVYLSIADTDSGWGESYTPTADEIKAYFYGWRMKTSGQQAGSGSYSGTGTKAWVEQSIVRSNPASIAENVDFAAVKNSFGNYNAWGDSLTPYRLMYQLAQSVDEPVTYEGSLMLHEGENQVEVGTGIVVREAVNVYSGTTTANINITTQPSSFLKYRVGRPSVVYRNGKQDVWGTATDIAKGNYRYRLAIELYEPSAAYSVTYLALDTYTLGIAPQTINAECAPNLRESVESLVRELVETRTETSVLQNTKAQKQQPQWINATLMSDWTGTFQYRKNELGQLEVSLSVTSGVVTILTRIATLPVGYRPSQTLVIRLNKNATGSMVNGEIYINKNGTVTVAASSSLETGTVYQATTVSPTL